MGSLPTESRNPRSVAIDTMSAAELVDLINEEDSLVAPAVRNVRESVVEAVELVAAALAAGGRLIYVGAGTSGRLGVLDAAECPPTFGTDPETVQGVMAGGYGALVRAREGAEDDERQGALDLRERGPGPSDVVAGIATSGVTPYVLGALGEARASGSRTLFVCCNPDTAEAVDADVIIAPLVGPEIVTGSTRMKAGTATKMVLNMITTSSMILLGKTYENLMVDLQVTCEKLRDRSARILVEMTDATYEEAGALIAEAGGSVKTAIVMRRAGVGREDAERMLARSGGFVRRALGDREESGQ